MARSLQLLVASFVAIASACHRAESHAPTPTPPPPTPLPVTPELVSSDPPDGSGNVARTTWIVLSFASPVDPGALGNIVVSCDGSLRAMTIAAIGDGSRIVVNPDEDLPDAAACRVDFRGPSGPRTSGFTTASRGAPAHALYDPNDPSRPGPIPDDLWLADDSTTKTGARVALSPPVDPSVAPLFVSALEPTHVLDGWSPIAPFVIELDEAADPKTLPHSAVESLDPLATVGLFDVDGASAGIGTRIPFTLRVDDRTTASGNSSHVLIVFPARPLEPMHRHAFVVLRRALVDPTRPIDPSEPVRAALAGEPATTLLAERSAALTRVVVSVLAEHASPPIHADDVALVLRVSTRSLDRVPDDVLRMRSLIQSAAPPTFTIDSVAPDTDPNVAAIVHGTFQVPVWIDPQGTIVRDGQGAPVSSTTETVPFVVALPKAAMTGPVPAVMLQHGHPSDANFIVTQIGRADLAPIGIAGIGFTDLQMRRPELQSLEYVLGGLLAEGRIADYQKQTWSDQLAFLRLLPTLEQSLDVLPLNAQGLSSPDGKLDLDSTAPLLYGGFSAGSFHGVGLLAYAPELRAATLAVGAGNYCAKLMHQQNDAIHDGLVAKTPALTRAEVYMLFALAQMAFDDQDPLVNARFARRAPILAGEGTSLFLTEGIGDTLVPIEATRAAAWQLGLPQIGRIAVPVGFLDVTSSPLTANLDPTTSGAFVQFVPVGVAGIDPTPACAAENQAFAHFCADVSKGVGAARAAFYQSALRAPVPTIPVVDN